ncbi:MAG TPA: hypothetical protein VFK89_03860 [Actinomycetota bacterium]|nr:hypothetical protein [Actinomycetota bacterium]
MEIEGHPTQDLLDELERRGAVRALGNSNGPRVDAIRFVTERLGDVEGFWLFVPRETFMTGLDDPPI